MSLVELLSGINGVSGISSDINASDDAAKSFELSMIPSIPLLATSSNDRGILKFLSASKIPCSKHVIACTAHGCC